MVVVLGSRISARPTSILFLYAYMYGSIYLYIWGMVSVGGPNTSNLRASIETHRCFWNFGRPRYLFMVSSFSLGGYYFGSGVTSPLFLYYFDWLLGYSVGRR